MKKVLFIVCLTFMLTGCFASYDDYNLLVYVSDDEECEIVEFFDLYGQGYSGVCINAVKIVKSDGTVNDLENVLTDGDITIDDLTSILEEVETLGDGGTTIYSGEEYNIIRCQNLAGTNDILITRTDVEYEESFCEK